jgi:uracil-DNA glycosylase
MSTDVRIEPSWKDRLAGEFSKEYFECLTDYVRNEYRSGTVYPPAKYIFRAFDLCPFDAVRVVIVGQDPYHEANQAIGLCFAVEPNVPHPPSLVNIFQEIETDLGRKPHTDSTLLHWVNQGVFLLNATLTVKAHRAASHAGKGWEQFTDAALHRLAEEREGLVFILWGAYAQKKGSFISTEKHLVITSPHPSPLSAYRGFFGSRPFSRANAYLAARGKQEIDW